MLRKCLIPVTLFLLAISPPAAAQAPTTQTSSPAATKLVRVALVCEGCDLAALKTAVAFVEFVTAPTEADVDVVIGSAVIPAGSAAGAPDATREWRFQVTGKGRFAGRTRTIPLPVRVTTAADVEKADLGRMLKLVLAEFAADTPAFADMTVTSRRNITTTPATPPKDPWNFWVFRLGANAYGNGQSSTFDGSYNISGSANRTTEEWKIRLSANRGISRSSFKISDEDTIETHLSDWSSNALIVKSLGPKWSLGFNGSVSGSTYSNDQLVASVMPGIEFDVFPYSESSKRSLTIQYNIGGSYHDYERETIFDRLSESVAEHSLNASLGLDQPWGSAGGSINFTQQLSSPDRTRVTLFGNMNVRLLKSLSLNGFASYSRIRDQFSLEKGEASEDEVLLRQRQLATGHRFSMSVGISYSFGNLRNNTVNPRFQ